MNGPASLLLSLRWVLLCPSFQVDAIQVEMQKDVRKDEVLTFYKIRKDED